MKKILLILMSVFFVFNVYAEADTDELFNQWVVEFKKMANEKHGIENEILDEAFKDIKFNAKVIKLDRNQPEFKKDFTTYYNNFATKKKIEEGKNLLIKHDELLKAVQKKYNVQPQIIVAFWGKETDFGRNMGKSSVISVLATLAFDGRRSKMFTSELINAFKIIQSGKIDLEDFKGSWAGAFGNFQFMPSTFLSYAVDGNGDGKIDLRGSLEDSFYSAANYLSKMGWNSGYKWGRRVSFDKKNQKILEELKSPNWKNLEYFSEIGVKTFEGNPLPKNNIKAKLVAPMGVDGQVFLVYENFKYIMKWNASTNYALSIGLFADEIAKK